MKKYLKPLFVTLIVLAGIYFSFDIHSLDSARARPGVEVFEVEVFTEDVWNNQLPDVIENSIEIGALLRLIDQDPETAFHNHGHKLGISNTWYFMARGAGTLVELGEETALIQIDDETTVELALLYLFGNASREGSGLVDISDFLNMMDFNLVSVHLNRIARNQVVEPFKKVAKEGQQVSFAGAFEINRNNPDIQNLVLIPVMINVTNQ